MLLLTNCILLQKNRNIVLTNKLQYDILYVRLEESVA